MKKNKLVLLLVLCSGCTMVSNDRIFPKLTWAWTAEAKEQRKSNEVREKNEAFNKQMEKQYGPEWYKQFPK